MPAPPTMTSATGHAIPQSSPPRPPRETLPTMYDLPSEWPEEPGLPDEFHDLQPQLLSRTLALADYSRDNWYAASDLNLYYNVHHPLWHKRPDWFLAVGVPRLYERRELRHSYVTWQEGQNPHVVVEFLSPGTEKEDLGRFYRSNEALPSDEPPNPAPAEQPPGKFTVYEQQLRVPHYITYDRRTQHLRYFQLLAGQYQEHPLAEDAPQIWLPDLKVGLGIWSGTFEGIPSHWLRWCDLEGNWLWTDTERAEQAQAQERQAKEQERQAKEQERQAKEAAQTQVLQTAQALMAQGMTLAAVTALMQLSPEQVAQISVD
ncbi:Uma2 family endonuclease [Leptolyngbya sp. PCC 6406]|uniref:Uma2 family endonuclease n=1 Tax=Leptolyngbya sp. PCC 6406 TaxID=1173264 RepID=UPI0002AC9DBA|nr:Uma2 family endonuclease [Leptolyngbya sp. PCC 6406]